jgi:hypothetical protein
MSGNCRVSQRSMSDHSPAPKRTFGSGRETSTNGQEPTFDRLRCNLVSTCGRSPYARIRCNPRADINFHFFDRFRISCIKYTLITMIEPNIKYPLSVQRNSLANQTSLSTLFVRPCNFDQDSQ